MTRFPPASEHAPYGPARTLRLPGLVAENLTIPYDIALLDLTLFIRDRDEGLFALLEYNADLFEAATIERMKRIICAQ